MIWFLVGLLFVATHFVAFKYGQIRQLIACKADIEGMYADAVRAHQANEARHG